MSKYKDSINFELTGKTVKFLSIYDTIQKGDFIRDLVETGYDGGFNRSFKPSTWRGLAWHLVENELSGWIGKTYLEYIKFGKDDVDWSKENLEEWMFHEIVRVVNE